MFSEGIFFEQKLKSESLTSLTSLTTLTSLAYHLLEHLKLDAIVNHHCCLLCEAAHTKVEQLPGEKRLSGEDIRCREKPGRDEGKVLADDKLDLGSK